MTTSQSLIGSTLDPKKNTLIVLNAENTSHNFISALFRFRSLNKVVNVWMIHNMMKKKPKRPTNIAKGTAMMKPLQVRN